MQHGWGQYALSMIQALQAQGIDLKIISAVNSPDVDGLTQHKILPSVVPERGAMPVRLLQALPQVRQLLSDCDVLHSTVEFYAPLVASIKGQRKAFLTVHGSYVHLPVVRRFPFNRMFKWAFEQCELICVSRYTQSRAYYIVPKAKSHVVPNGVDIDRFQQLPVMPNPPQCPTILTAGGIKKRKGTLPLVDAMATVRQDIPDAQLIVIGNDKAEMGTTAQVKQAIEANNLEDSVQLLGFVDDELLLQWYGAADIFALPSINDGWKFEGFGLVHLEASAAGLPVIGTTDCGAEDAIDDGVTGILVEQAKVDELLPDAIIKLLSKPKLAQKMGAAGKQKAARMTWQRAAEQVIGLYQA